MGLLDVSLLAEPKQRGSERPQLWRDPGGRHLLDEVEGEVRVLLGGGKAGHASEGGLIRGNAVETHLAVDLEAALEADGVGGGGAEVEEDVEVVDGEGSGGSAGVVVEVEGPGEVPALGAQAELVAEEALGGLAAGLLGHPGGGGARVR